jgi:drug/metabolite transporter (DMT)-like permease
VKNIAGNDGKVGSLIDQKFMKKISTGVLRLDSMLPLCGPMEVGTDVDIRLPDANCPEEMRHASGDFGVFAASRQCRDSVCIQRATWYGSVMSAIFGVLYGLGACVSWGIGDFFAGRGSKHHGPLEMLLVTQIGGLMLMFCLFLATGPVWISISAFLNYALRFSLLAGGFICFYRGLALGSVGIVSTIGAGYSFVTVLLIAVLGRESLTVMQWMGIIMIMIGLAFLSLTRESIRTAHLDKSILYALGAMFFWGVYYIFLDAILDDIGWIPTIFYRYLCTVLWLVMFFAIARMSAWRAVRHVGVSMDIVAVVLGELVGQFALHYGMTRAPTSIIIPGSAVGPLVTVILARIFLYEHCTKTKMAGIAFTIGGLVFLH